MRLVFNEKIDPEHPLAKATRDLDDLASLDGDLAFESVGFNCPLEQVFAFAEQRVIRSIGVTTFNHHWGQNAIQDELMARVIVGQDGYLEMLTVLLPTVVDALSTGWVAAKLAAEDKTAD